MNKSHAPAASVILPIYNQSESLRIVLKHLSNQQCHPAEYEIIVVDDGSTDALREKIAVMIGRSQSVRLLIYTKKIREEQLRGMRGSKRPKEIGLFFVMVTGYPRQRL